MKRQILDGSNPDDREFHRGLVKLAPNIQMWFIGRSDYKAGMSNWMRRSGTVEDLMFGVYYTYGDNPNEITGLK